MSDYLRVTWKATGHESSIPASRFDSDRHRELSEKDATDSTGAPLPPKYKTTVTKAAAVKRTSAKPKPKPKPNPKPDPGQQADLKKEQD